MSPENNRKTHGGKGDARRIGSNQKAYEEGWERIFGNKKKEIPTKEGLQNPEDVVR